MIGGRLDHNYGITCGPEVLEELDRMNFSTALIGASAVSDSGVSSFDRDVSVINRKVLSRSKKRILLVDSTKFSAFSHHVFARIEDFNHIITTAKAGVDSRDMANLVLADTADL